MSATKYFNRYNQKEEIEAVYGEKSIGFLYETKAGQKLSALLARPFVSQLYGLYQDSALSRSKIPDFISNFNIPMEDFEANTFSSFNDFFIRKFIPGKRPFARDKSMGSFAEGRFLAFEHIEEETRFPVKGHFLKARDLLGNAEEARAFEGGPLIVARLCPVDYHRFHFPDDGEILKSWTVSGALQSVNPMALKFKGDIFITNERHVSILKTKTFGKLAYIEVGAMMVGKIVQSHKGPTFTRGEEKGYFLFGGSTVILMGEPHTWKPSPDILAHSQRGLETYVHLGDQIAVI